jgi:hypothetical protein
VKCQSCREVKKSRAEGSEVPRFKPFSARMLFHNFIFILCDKVKAISTSFIKFTVKDFANNIQYWSSSVL